ncbi:hypothetical protein Dimus_032983, partial [Dionaea muscipula]
INVTGRTLTSVQSTEPDTSYCQFSPSVKHVGSDRRFSQSVQYAEFDEPVTSQSTVPNEPVDSVQWIRGLL